MFCSSWADFSSVSTDPSAARRRRGVSSAGSGAGFGALDPGDVRCIVRPDAPGSSRPTDERRIRLIRPDHFGKPDLLAKGLQRRLPTVAVLHTGRGDGQRRSQNSMISFPARVADARHTAWSTESEAKRT